MSEKSALDILVEETASAARKAVDEAKFDTSTYGVITEKAGTAYKVAAFGGVYRFTSSHEYSVGQKVVVTALQKNFRNIVVTEGNTNVELLNIKSVVGRLGNDLEKLSDKTDSEQKEVQSQINNTITTYYRYKDPSERDSNDPSVDWTTDEQKKAHNGDLYQNVQENHCFRWADTGEGYEWVRITDSGLINALSMATYARDTANSKSQTFTQKPTPMYNTGDFWTEGPSGDLYVCIKSRSDTEAYSKDDWILATKYTDDTLAKKVSDDLNTHIDVETGRYNELSQSISKTNDSVTALNKTVAAITLDNFLAQLGLKVNNDGALCFVAGS